MIDECLWASWNGQLGQSPAQEAKMENWSQSATTSSLPSSQMIHFFLQLLTHILDYLLELSPDVS